MSRYEPLQEARFRKELVPGGYEFVIPARRNWFVLAFLLFWICGWTFGGIAAIEQNLREPGLFLTFWLGGWLIGWAFAASQILYMVTGAEYIRCAGGDLELGYKGLTLPLTRTFKGSEVRKLEACDQPVRLGNFRGWEGPLGRKSQNGSIRFDYGARTIYAANSLDRAEAEMIVADLQRSMPAAR